MDPRLRHLLELQERGGGTISFETFMAAALYHPDFGYYTNLERGVGSRGDFSTSATLGTRLARAVHAWIRKHDDHAPGWIEIGPGDGSLAAEILKADGWFARWKRKLVLVERSPALRDLQRSKLGNTRVRWADSVGAALAMCGGHATIYSNELVDAFPCRVFQKTGTGWAELHLRIDQGKVIETLVETPLPDSTGFDPALDFPVGQRIEVHESHHRWLETWIPAWKRGAMLTIDYGGVPGTIYARRPRGTLRAYWKHQRFEGSAVYARFGKQDLTADVNTDDLQRSGTRLGLKTGFLQTQAAFLAKFQAGMKTARDEFVAAPGGAGDAFFALEQKPGGIGR